MSFADLVSIVSKVCRNLFISLLSSVSNKNNNNLILIFTKKMNMKLLCPAKHILSPSDAAIAVPWRRWNDVKISKVFLEVRELQKNNK
jgi:hypothetical protein